MQAFDYVSPHSVEETVALLFDHGEQARVLAGGTDLLIQMREGRRRAELLVDIKRIPEATAITYNPQTGLSIGAAASCYAISHDSHVIENYPGLLDAVKLVGGVQIQYRASLGGNLCNASPAADTVPALIVHEAICSIAGKNGYREVAAEDFCISPGKTVLQRGEYLLAIHLPPRKSGFGAGYLRFIPRNEMDIAVVGAGAGVTLDEDKTRFTSVRVALGAVAPTPLLIEGVNSCLAGKDVTTSQIQEAIRLAQAQAKPISDLRGTAEYRTHLCAVLAQRALEKAIERARNNK